jgi:hypothetical protein
MDFKAINVVYQNITVSTFLLGSYLKTIYLIVMYEGGIDATFTYGSCKLTSGAPRRLCPDQRCYD